MVALGNAPPIPLVLEAKGSRMTSEEQRIVRKDLRATMSGDPDRDLELTLEKNPGDKQAQADVGSDGSMDASDPPSACQPGGNDPVPSNNFPETEAE